MLLKGAAKTDRSIRENIENGYKNKIMLNRKFTNIISGLEGENYI